jgi:ribonuclease-3
LIRLLFNRPRDPEERRVRAWCRKTLGIVPGDLALYRQALRHVSAVTEERPDLPDNERMEFLGDAVLDAIIGDLLFSTYPDQGEGFLTRMRSKLVSRSQLNGLAQRIEIERVMESNLARSHESSVPGNALEALIGALFLDKGFERTRKVVVKLIKTHIELAEVAKEDKDGKSRLLEWGQKRRKKVEFVVREETGGQRGKFYVAEVRINGLTKGTGKGNSKKVAEQDAAQSAFRSMRSRRNHAPASTTEAGEHPKPVKRPVRRRKRKPGSPGDT